MNSSRLLRTILIKSLCLFFSTSIYSQVDLASGLIAYYPFDGDANDLSINKNDAVVKGPLLAEDRHGNPNSAYLFDGLDDIIEASGVIAPPRSFTVSFWIEYQSSRHEWATLIEYGTDAPYLGLRNEKLNFYQVVQLDSLFVKDEWNFVTLTYDEESGEGILHINGNAIKAGINTNLNQSGVGLRIGKSKHSSSFNGWPFKGKLDDIRVYNRILNQEEINYLFNPLTSLNVGCSECKEKPLHKIK